MIRELAAPLAVDIRGRFSTTTDPTVQAAQHLVSYLATGLGERVMRPTFGTPLAESLFDNMDAASTDLLRSRVADALASDVTDIVVQSIEIDTSSDQDGELDITVTWSLAAGVGSLGDQQTTTTTLGGLS